MELYESLGETAFYTWRALTVDSASAIYTFADNLISSGMVPTPTMKMDDLHMSIIRCQNELPLYHPDQSLIQVQPLRWALLGGPSEFFLALITNLDPRIDTQVKRAQQQGGRFLFDSYLPHISVLRYDQAVVLKALPLPAFSIALEAEESVPFHGKLTKN